MMNNASGQPNANFQGASNNNNKPPRRKSSNIDEDEFMENNDYIIDKERDRYDESDLLNLKISREVVDYIRNANNGLIDIRDEDINF
jgi:hypothetical protein